MNPGTKQPIYWTRFVKTFSFILLSQGKEKDLIQGSAEYSLVRGFAEHRES